MLQRRGESAQVPVAGAWPRRAERRAAGTASELRETRRLVRTAGTMLAIAALILAFTAGAQGAVYGPAAEGNGALAWVFAIFVGVSVIAVFLFVLYLVRPPAARRPGDPPPGSAHERT